MSTTTPEAPTFESLRDSTEYTITRQEAAVILGVSPRTVSSGIAEGNIPAIRLGRRVVIPRAKFLALFDVPENK